MKLDETKAQFELRAASIMGSHVEEPFYTRQHSAGGGATAQAAAKNPSAGAELTDRIFAASYPDFGAQGTVVTCWGFPNSVVWQG